MAKREPREGEGRPALLEFDPKIGETVVSLLQEGQYLETAVHFAGLSISTVRLWIKKGARDRRAGIDSVYAQFSTACKKARSSAEIADIRGIVGSGQWQALAWRRERMNPDRWGKREHVEHSGGLKIVREIVGVNPEEV